MKKAIIIYQSRTGITRSFGEEIGRYLNSKGLDAKVMPVQECDGEVAGQYEFVFLGCWTAGFMLLFQHPDRHWVKFVKGLPDLKDKNIAMGDDSIVRGSVSEGGSVWVVYNAGAKFIEFWISYGPMFFPSFKEWHRGPECLHELAVQRAFQNDNPYDKTLEEINEAVAKLIGVDEVKYNLKENIEKVAGEGSFQALDASYPIDEAFWPDWLKREVDQFKRYQNH